MKSQGTEERASFHP